MKRQLITQSLLGGILLALSFPPFGFWPLAFVCFIPLFSLVYKKEISQVQIFLAGLIVGLIYFGSTVRWWFSLHPLDWMGVDSGPLSLVFVSAIFGVVILFCGAIFGFFALSVRAVSSWNFKGSWVFKYAPTLAVPSLFVLLEYLRAFAYGVFWSGPGSLAGPHWSFANLGYVLHDQDSLRMLASVGGVYLLSFLIVLVNVLFWRVYVGRAHSKARVSAVLLLGLLLLWWLGGSLIERSVMRERANIPTDTLKAVLVTTDFPAAYSQNVKTIKATALHEASQLERLAQALELKPDLIVFPEGSEVSTALLGKFADLEGVKNYFDLATEGHPVVLLDNILSKPESHSRLLYIDSRDGLLDYYDKRMIFPGGEYIPEIIRALMSVFGGQDLLKKVEYLRVLSPGERPNVVVATRYGQIGGLICSAIISTELPRAMTRAGAEILAVSSSNALFRSNKVILAGNDAMSQLRAVESGRYLLLATNGGESIVVNPAGEIVARQGADEALKLVSIERRGSITLYVRFGNWIVLASALLLAAFYLRARRSASAESAPVSEL